MKRPCCFSVASSSTLMSLSLTASADLPIRGTSTPAALISDQKVLLNFNYFVLRLLVFPRLASQPRLWMEGRKRKLFDASRCLGGHEMATIEELLARSVHSRFSRRQSPPGSNPEPVRSRSKLQQAAASQMEVHNTPSVATCARQPVLEEAKGCYIDEGMYIHHDVSIWNGCSCPCTRMHETI